MEYRLAHRREHDALIRCEIELDAGPACRCRRRDRPPKGNFALAVLVAARIVVDIEVLAVGGHFKAALLVDPLADLGEHFL